MNGGETKLIYTAGPLYINGERTMREILKGRPIKKSHIIAAILVIIVLLVSASFFYVFLNGRTERPCAWVPLGINRDGRTENSVTVLIVSVPTGAKIDGTVISYGHNGTPERVIYAEIHDRDGTPVATYSGCDSHWSYCNNIQSTINWQKGMTLEVYVSSVHEGDVLTISSTPYTFATSTITVK